MSLRPYDKLSNKRFDQTHPLFPKTKSGPNKGKPSKTLTKRHIEALGDKVDLVPNLTHLTGVLDSFDAFSGGSRWGAHVAKGVLIDYSRTGKKACENVQEVSRLVNDQMSEAADNGSIIHDNIEHMLIRAMNGAEETEHPVLFKTVGRALNMQGISVSDVCSLEEQIVTDEYGFTLDYVNHGVRVIDDWKTVSKASWEKGDRKPKASEALQLATICKEMEKQRGGTYRVANVYIAREDLSLLGVVEWPREVVEYMANVLMPECVKLYKIRDIAKNMVSKFVKEKK